jgi:DNA-binding transcriptional LysR family regulator
MNLIDLEAFVSVVDHGSVVAAAAGLHLTQSAVTRRIQNLEDALGTPLLDRQTRPLQPTRAGQETYEFAKPVLSSVNDLKTGIMHGGEPSCDRSAHQVPPRRFPEGANPGVCAMEWGAFGATCESSPGLRRCASP